MKTKIQYVFIAALLLLWTNIASGNETTVPSKIKHITVFLKGAQIVRKGSVNITTGTHILVFRSLSSDIREGSIQVEGKGNFTILSVKHRTNFMNNPEENPELQALQKKLDAYNRSKEDLSIKMQVVKSQESMLEKNQTVTGQNGLSVTALNNAMEFYRKKMTELMTSQLGINRKLQELEKKIKQVKMQMKDLSKKKKMATGEVAVTIVADKPGLAVFTLSYYVPGASWRPEYDVRVDDITKEIKIDYKAFIKQTTGEIWDKVPVTLSTGNPAIGGNKPELYPWYLDFKPEVIYKGVRSKGMPVRAEMSLPPSGTAASYTKTIQKQTTTEFSITLPWTLLPENREEAVTIKHITLPAVYAYYVVPKLSRDVFLTASVTEWKKQDFLSGKMNLFLEGRYTGTAYLDVSGARDTLRLTLGRDKRIKVERRKIEDVTKKQMLGNNFRETHGWKITALNTKRVPVHLIIEDQIPVSKRKEIVVEPLELTGAHLNAVTGKVTWEVTLKPEQSASFVLKFSVKYPKNEIINID